MITFPETRLSKIDNFRERIVELDNALYFEKSDPITNNSFDELFKVVIEWDCICPKLAKSFANLSKLVKSETVRQLILDIAFELFRANTLIELETIGSGEFRLIDIDRLICTDRRYDADYALFVGQSIRKIGVIEPIVCFSMYPSMHIRVWDGSLRVKSIRACGHSKIPAYVYTHGTMLTKAQIEQA